MHVLWPPQRVDWEREKLPEVNWNYHTQHELVTSRSAGEIREQLNREGIKVTGTPPMAKPLQSFREAGFPPKIQEHLEVIDTGSSEITLGENRLEKKGKGAGLAAPSRTCPTTKREDAAA
eukprot:GHVT01032794.1.p2 GENE.GHVT01032794.1~~GHVT01032794.1.p2  ORF type:complete len:120 (-),score=17.87 GHVT01032794.1:16-375(-)